ncbi:glycosyltransferase family 4 protein [Halovivax cerinus]|uniref:Glycosyltransferase family 4 protein n=1 Tax=Halovivax cerinus TaxID=1487865 RepID=A0ABD5NQX5_9EURY|nr:glycosyltransferase family 4 protein [Halovivax cerinus]
MRVLNLVTTPRPFFDAQVRILEDCGVECTTLLVPGRENGDARSVTDYLRYYPSVLRRSLDGYDLVHANFGLTAPFALAQPTRPVVCSLWGTDLAGSYGGVSERCVPFCDEVIVMSEPMNDRLSVDATVVPHGIDLTQFSPRPQRAAQAAVGWDPEPYHVLFPYDPERSVKNYPRAERVVERVRATVEEPIALQVVYGVDHAEIPRYMNAADALLVTSRREGSPNTVKEAMACDLPVVSTDVGDVDALLDPVSNSYVCDSTDQLAARLATVLTSDRRSDGSQFVDEYSLEAMATDILSVYRRALDRS